MNKYLFCLVVFLSFTFCKNQAIKDPEINNETCDYSPMPILNYEIKATPDKPKSTSEVEELKKINKILLLFIFIYHDINLFERDISNTYLHPKSKLRPTVLELFGLTKKYINKKMSFDQFKQNAKSTIGNMLTWFDEYIENETDYEIEDKKYDIRNEGMNVIDTINYNSTSFMMIDFFLTYILEKGILAYFNDLKEGGVIYNKEILDDWKKKIKNFGNLFFYPSNENKEKFTNSFCPNYDRSGKFEILCSRLQNINITDEEINYFELDPNDFDIKLENYSKNAFKANFSGLEGFLTKIGKLETIIDSAIQKIIILKDRETSNDTRDELDKEILDLKVELEAFKNKEKYKQEKKCQFKRILARIRTLVDSLE